MKKILLVVIMIIGLSSSRSAMSASVIYDESKDIVYLGGFGISNLQYVFEKIEPQNEDKIYAIDTKNNKAGVLINAGDRIFAYELSAKGYLAVSTSMQEKGKITYINKLIIYKTTGERLTIIDNVLSKGFNNYFSWSGDGNKIVYVKGEDVIEGRVQPRGVWIYDIVKNEEVMISKWGAEVNWSKHDNNIYIQNEFKEDNPSDVSVYNTTTNKLTRSDHNGVIFSSDGKYYIGYMMPGGYESYAEYIYEAATNKKLLASQKEAIWNKEMLYQIIFIRNTHYVLTWSWKGGYKVFDVDKGNVIRRVDKAGVVGWNKDIHNR